MTRSMKVLCSLVLVAALVLASLLYAGLFRGFAALSSTEKELSESRAHWEKVAEEKEALQDQLAEVIASLKEADLTLSESETRAVELRADIAQLEAEIESLSARTSAAATAGEPAVPASGAE